MWHASGMAAFEGETRGLTRSTPPTRASGTHHRWSIAARVGGVVVAIVVLNLFVAGLPLRYAQLTALAPATLADLAWLGLTAHGYALLLLSVEAFVVGIFALTASVLFWHRSDDPLVLFVALMLLLLGVMNGIFVRSPWALVAQHPALALPCRILTAGAYASLVLFFFIFPDGRFTPPWSRWIALVLMSVVAGWTLAPRTDFLSVPWTPPLFLPVAIPLLGSLVGVQLYRFVRVSDETERQQTRWVVFGIAGSSIIFLEMVLLWQGMDPHVPFSVDTTQLVGQVVASLAVTLIPLTFGVAVTRNHLFDIDLLINRAVVYGGLTACVVAGYALLVGFFSQLFQTSGNVMISLLATGAIAVAFHPLRVWLQRAVNRMMWGERDDPYAVLSRLGQRIETTLAPDAVLPTIVETVHDALKLPYAAIALRQQDGLAVVASAGVVGSAPVAWPLTYQHETVGALLVSPRTADGSFNAADRRLLDDLARQAGIAAYAVGVTRELRRANDELRHGREQLISLREEERRRIRRNLHDGLGPALASLVFKLDAAHNLLRRDVERVDTLLLGASETAHEAITDIRRLVYDLRPPVLDQLGLSAALREVAVQHHGVRIAVNVPDALPPLPAAVEVAAYRIVQEALTNVTKHARARSGRVVLHADEDRLRVTVSDDGVGLPEQQPAGVGLQSMHERAAELGGVCAIERAPGGGTIVRAELPLPRDGAG